MTWRLRQAAVLAAACDETTERIGSTFDLATCQRNDEVPGFAMSTALLAVGHQFVEVASPLDDDSPAGRRLARRGEGGYLVILQTDDIGAARQRAEAVGATVTMEIERPGAREIHLHPTSTAGVALAIDWMDPPDSWAWAGPDWERTVRTDLVTGLAGVTIAADEPQAPAARWADILDVELDHESDASTLWLDTGWIRFERRAGSAPTLSRLHLIPTAPGSTHSVSVGACEITTRPGTD